ncbi:MAG: DNRLRE domain-containing protein, partial [Planctomycetota bacterium]
AVEVANFLVEGVYLNIHTTAHAGGEIRGQLIPSQVTIEPVRDNTLYESITGPLSNGAGSHLFAGRSGDGLKKRGLIMFDIAGSGIPAGSVITSAVLQLSMSRTTAGPEPVGLHRVRSDWGEGTSDATRGEGEGAAATPGDATWLYTFFNTDFWINPGGDFLAVSSDTQVIADIGEYTWGSTAGMVSDVQHWLDAPITSAGC